MTSFSTLLQPIAQLGTAKQSALPTLPEPFQPFMQRLQGQSLESILYQISSLAFAYEQASQTLPMRTEAHQPPHFTPDATKPTLPEEAREVVEEWLNQSHSEPLLRFAFMKIHASGYALPSSILMKLFQKDRIGLCQSLHQSAFGRELLGAHGEFIGKHMGFWDSGENQKDTDESFDFSLETTANRAAWLSLMRQKNPVLAREAVQQSWKSDGADVRERWLKSFEVGLSLDDEAFLQSALEKDRSQRVREVAMDLLERLPSMHSKRLEEWWVARVSYRDNTWHYTPQPFEAEMKKLGFEAISSQKRESDDNFILRQLMLRLRPEFYAQWLGVDEESAIKILLNNPPVKGLELRDAVQHWGKRFPTAAVIKALLSKEIDERNSELLGYLSVEDKEDVMRGAVYKSSGFKALNESESNDSVGVTVRLSRTLSLPVEQKDEWQTWGQEYTQFVFNLIKNYYYWGEYELFPMIVHLPTDESTEQVFQYLCAKKAPQKPYLSVFKQKQKFLKALCAV
ncbi:MAG: DUF5691 domain-containing protein [Cardiobacteriaceae bacterium]|nr:DUF5691 domain-containing protein [Cardiobacteriaceae bacterium]